MKNLILAVLLIIPTITLASDTYNGESLHMPSVIVGSNTYEVDMIHQGDLVFKVTKADNITFPDRFTVDWLAGKTLFDVWHGRGTDSDGNEIENIVGIAKLVFGSDGIVQFIGIQNEISGSTEYHVNSNGELYFSNDSSYIYKICGKTSNYLIVEYYENGTLDNIELLYLNQEDAINSARNITGQIPGCS